MSRQLPPPSADTICALATGAAPAGVAVIRISGPAALRIARKVARLPEVIAPRHALVGAVVDPATGAQLDTAVVIYFQAPQSFTGEDVVEIHGHGGLRQVDALLAAVQAAGARAAEPGEFSRRAVLNGRMSLDQAEAIADLVAAETEQGLAAARGQLFGALGERVRAIAAEGLTLQAEVEASLDFPDEAGEVPHGLPQRAAALRARCEALLATHRIGRALREGVRVVLAGAPNAGKSSLFNALLGEARAIVDADPGTTRDTLEARVELAGVPCTLVDTAGLREDAGRVEQLGIERARNEIARGGVCLWVVDATAPVPPPERSQPWLAVINKSDLAEPEGVEGARVSARTGQGIDALVAALGLRIRGDAGAAGEVVVTNRRHAELLAAAARGFQAAAGGAGEVPLEMIAYELRDAVGALDRILGRGVDDALLDEVFSKFCIGK